MTRMLGALLLATLLGADAQTQFTGFTVQPSTYAGGDQLTSLGVSLWPNAAVTTGSRLALSANYPIFSGTYANAQPFVVGSCRFTVAPAATDLTRNLAFTLSDAVAGTACSVATTAATMLPISEAYLGRNPDGCNTVIVSAVSTSGAGTITNALTQASYDTTCGSGSSGCWYLFFLFFLIPCCCIPCCLLLLFLRRRRNKPMGCRPVNPCCQPQAQWPCGFSSGLSSSFLPATTTMMSSYPAPVFSSSTLCAPASTPTLFPSGSAYYY